MPVGAAPKNNLSLLVSRSCFLGADEITHALELADEAVLTVSLDDDHGVPFFIEAADVAVGVVAGLILFVCTVSVTRN